MIRASFSDKRTAIERLHRQDIDATVGSEMERLLSLWTDDSVAHPPGGPPVKGKEAALAWLEKNRGTTQTRKIKKTVKYAPEVRQLKIFGRRAYEWGDFLGVHESTTGEVFETRGEFVRVLRQQQDGSWKFTRVAWQLDKPA